MSGNPGGGSAGRAERNDRVGRWLGRLNRSDHDLSLLFAASFLETLVVPIPIELILIPFVLATPGVADGRHGHARLPRRLGAGLRRGVLPLRVGR